MSASTCPGPTEGSWSTSPTSISAARWRHRLEQRVHQRHVDHRDLVHHQQVALERVLLAPLEAAPAGSASSRRWMVLASSPVASLIRLAARPVGAPGRWPGSWPARIFRMALTSVVLPTPGPPVITSSLERSARRTASRWLAASAIPSSPRPRRSPRPLRSRARAGGRWPVAAAARRCPARPGAARPGTRRHAVDGVGHHRALGELQLERGVDHLGRDLEQLGGQRTQLVGRQAAMALVHRLGQGEGDAGPGPDHRRLLDAEPRRDLVGGLEADAADVAGQPVGVLGDHLDRVGAVGLEDPHRPRGADAVAVQEQHDLADHLLLRPAPPDALGALGADAGHLAQALGASARSCRTRPRRRPGPASWRRPGRCP